MLFEQSEQSEQFQISISYFLALSKQATNQVLLLKLMELMISKDFLIEPVEGTFLSEELMFLSYLQTDEHLIFLYLKI